MFLATASEEIRLWNFNGDGAGDKRLNLVHSFNPHHEQISKVAWTNDNSMLGSACKSGKSLFLTSFPDKDSNSVKLEVSDPPETCLTFNSSGRFVLSGSLNGKIAIYDVKKASMKRSYNPVKPGNSTTCVSFSLDDHNSISGHKGGEIVIINIRSGQVYSPMYISGATSGNVSSNGGAVQVLEFSRFNKTVLASGHSYGMVALWNTSHRIVSSIMDNHHRGPCMDLAFSPVNEMLLISCGLDRTIRCFDVQQGSHVRSVETAHPLLCVSLAKDGYNIAAGTSNGKVLFYDLRALDAPVEILNAHTGPVSDVKFDNDPTMFMRNGSSESTSSTATWETARRSSVNSSIRKPLIEATNVESSLKAPPVDEVKPVEEAVVNESGNSSVNIYSVISPLASFNSSNSTTTSMVSKMGDCIAPLPKLQENKEEFGSGDSFGVTEGRGSKLLKSVHFDDKEESLIDGCTSETPVPSSHEESPRPTEKYLESITSEIRDISFSSPRSQTESESASLAGTVSNSNAVAATELSRIALELRGDISQMREDVNQQLFDWYAKMVWQLCVTENRIVNHVNKLLDDREALTEEVERLRKENERLRKTF